MDSVTQQIRSLLIEQAFEEMQDKTLGIERVLDQYFKRKPWTAKNAFDEDLHRSLSDQKAGWASFIFTQSQILL